MNERTAHLSLYRRWRPQRFADVIGQDEVIRTLQNAVAKGDVAHAYLFAGERGIGKTSIARILTRALNCLSPVEGEPCNECANCRTILENRSLDVVEIDGASNRGIDHIRRLREEVNFSPTDLRTKVYIIDEVHMLTNEAFNALLKTLEEPPPHVVFIFATTEPHKLPRTIVSRCQAFEFRRIGVERIAAHLAQIAADENAEATEEALRILAVRANGGMRDAIVMLEQAMSYEGGTITGEGVLDMLGLAGREVHEAFIAAIEDRDASKVLAMIGSLVDRGRDLDLFLSDVIQTLRDRIAAGGPATARDVTAATGLLRVKSDLFRALDRQVRLEIGVLDLMQSSGPLSVSKEQPVAQTVQAVPAQTAPETNEAQDVTEHEAEAVSPQPSATEEPVPAAQGDSSAPDAPVTAHHAAGVSSELDKTWKEMLAEIERDRIALAAFLVEARPTLADDRLTISFHPEHTFHKKSLELQANLQYLAGSVHRYFGDTVRVEIGFDEGVAPQPLPSKQLLEKARLICDMFDGKIVKEEL